MKFIFLAICLFFLSAIYSQTKTDSLLQRDVDILVEEMEFMYAYDQTMREYTFYKTFDKSETNRLESLSDSLLRKEMLKRKFISDTIKNYIYKNYINPKDALHTKRMIEITKKYGFPSIERLQKYYKKEFVDPEFNPIILLIHSPKEFWEELKILMLNEFNIGRINQCSYGYLLWQFTGRKSFQPMLENGYEMVEEDGKKTFVSTCK